MKIIAKQSLYAGTYVEHGLAPDKSGLVVILFLHEGLAREVKVEPRGIAEDPPKPGDVIIEHATHVDWMPYQEFSEHYHEVP